MDPEIFTNKIERIRRDLEHGFIEDPYDFYYLFHNGYYELARNFIIVAINNGYINKIFRLIEANIEHQNDPKELEIIVDGILDLDQNTLNMIRDLLPLNDAIIYGTPDQVRLLLKAGVDPNKQDDKGNTALLFAIRNATPHWADEMIQLLINYGANPHIRNNKNESAFSLLNKIYGPKSNPYVYLLHKKLYHDVFNILRSYDNPDIKEPSD